ncbi:MAG TPA: Gfo/Idh/MocA family oxidoreductase [Chloroflexota bacterium]|nr:Gfo/Idh/MocA family oxidoreductase [Chloroflexota bacterium]
MSEKLRAGVIGLRRGASLARVLQAMADVDVVGIADPDEARLTEVLREHPGAQAGRNLTELLEVGLDLVVVATPVPYHVEHATTALAAGVHVLSEVPALARLDECDTLIAAVERSGRLYLLLENCCYWAFIDTVKQLHARGDFGSIFYAEAEYIHNIPELRRDAQGNPTWRATLDPITYITHSLGPIMWVTGEYPVETTAYGTTGHCEPGVPDVQVALFRMTNGGVARVTCSFANAHWGHHRFAFFGTQASFDSGSVGRDEPKFWSPALPNLSGPAHLPVGTNFPKAPRAAGLGGHGTTEWFMLEAGLNALRTGSPPPIDVYDAIMYSLPGLCAREALQSGKPVAIPPYYEKRCSRRSPR